ncbi:hypothetical protein SARC_00421 [Sphaeroforma arctica JP610]|uniref:Chaperone DnaJ C-terminal domain-containing protein n=1 Tax=Sphaeroforma arctica JP610 TaxID=667725 RepID=A0A0L0GEP1_9EUKA|nr:hypothetical protein SARC_00421 [Sphaeroforma arctica JP610]KNC87487.1 hypothetical protein SARC_00421 [Sphaeroforma arctica JP610]|eukprot:XP_014161389.1 hypothetical protein SARC_00421 [Sphaeroforma arctica JP610]
MKDGDRITLEAQGDQQAAGRPEADIVVVLQERENLRFRRKGDDLCTTLEIMLVEALCGFTRYITFVNNKKLAVTCAPGQVTTEGHRRCIPGLGMPIRGSPGKHGRLIVEFTVMFPPDNFADEASMAMLEGLLPPRPDLPAPRDDEEVHPGEFELQEMEDSDGGSELSGQYNSRPTMDNHTPSHGTRQVNLGDAMHMYRGRASLTSVPSSEMMGPMGDGDSFGSYMNQHGGGIGHQQQRDCQAQ